MLAKSLAFLPCWILLFLTQGVNAASDGVEFTFLLDGKIRPLRTWEDSQLKTLKQVRSKEKEPKLGVLIDWQGALLSEVFDQSVSHLSVSERASIDVLVLYDDQGHAVFMPRYLLQRFPLILMTAEPKNIHKRGKHYLILPWTSRPKLQKEQLPLSKYFVWNLRKIELTSFREKFPDVFLKRQTDPIASRGEKIFVRNCLACHGSRGNVTPATLLPEHKAEALAKGAHPKAEGAPDFDAKMVKALEAYSRVLRLEQREKAQ